MYVTFFSCIGCSLTRDFYIHVMMLNNSLNSVNCWQMKLALNCTNFSSFGSQSKTIFSFWLNIQLKWAFEEKKKELIFLSSLTSLLSQYCERQKASARSDLFQLGCACLILVSHFFVQTFNALIWTLIRYAFGCIVSSNSISQDDWNFAHKLSDGM